MPELTHDEMRRLETELSYIPGRMIVSHLKRMTRVMTTLVGGSEITYHRLFRKITRFDPDEQNGALIPMDAVLHDLGVLLQRLTHRHPFDAGAVKSRVHTVQEVAAKHRVTLRTVRRWAMSGMPLAYYRFHDGHYGWGVADEHLSTFMKARARKTARNGNPLSNVERETILERIAALEAGNNATSAEIVRRVTRESGRSAATIRRLIRKRDRERARNEVRRLPGGLSPEEQERLISQYRDGVPVRDLAGEFGRSPSAVYRILHEILVRQIVEQSINYIPSPEFAAADAEQRCLGDEGLFTFPPPPPENAPAPPKDALPYLRNLYAVPLLSRKREKELFRKYNYIKYRMAMVQEQIAQAGYRAGLVDRFEELRQAADQLRRILIRCNLRLVVSIAKRHAGPLVNLMELISEGNVCLMRTVECYNYTRNARFATYATWALTKHFARVVPEENYHTSTFVTGRDELFALVGDARPDPQERVEAVAHLRNILTDALGHLPERERVIIEAHYGTDGRPARTLEEIGRLFGLTRERIRQIEQRALGKLRDLVGPEALESLA